MLLKKCLSCREKLRPDKDGFHVCPSCGWFYNESWSPETTMYQLHEFKRHQRHD